MKRVPYPNAIDRYKRDWITDNGDLEKYLDERAHFMMLDRLIQRGLYDVALSRIKIRAGRRHYEFMLLAVETAIKEHKAINT